MAETYSLEPQQRALYEQRAVTLLGNQETVKQTQWLVPDSPPTTKSTPPLQYGMHYYNPEVGAAVPRPRNVAFTPGFPHRPDISRVGTISPFNSSLGLSDGY